MDDNSGMIEGPIHIDEVARRVRVRVDKAAAKRKLAGWKPIDSAPRETAVLLTGNGDICVGYWSSGRYLDGSACWEVHPQIWSGDDDRGGLARVEFTPTYWKKIPRLPNVE